MPRARRPRPVRPGAWPGSGQDPKVPGSDLGFRIPNSAVQGLRGFRDLGLREFELEGSGFAHRVGFSSLVLVFANPLLPLPVCFHIRLMQGQQPVNQPLLITDTHT